MSLKSVSDVVARSTIVAITQKCERDDCCLSATYLGGTLMGTTKHYDKWGNLIVKDENHRQTKVGCMKCWNYWEVDQSGDIIHEVRDANDKYRKPTFTVVE